VACCEHTQSDHPLPLPQLLLLPPPPLLRLLLLLLLLCLPELHWHLALPPFLDAAAAAQSGQSASAAGNHLR
jgi:hypothetical protein